MFIYVEEDGDRIELMVNELWTIKEVKRQIQRGELRVPVHQQHLFFNGIELDNDSKTLLNYGVTSGSYIMIDETHKPFFITVVDYEGFSYRIEFEEKSPEISMLKEKVSERLDLPVCQIQLFFKGKELDGDSFLCPHLFNHGIEYGSSITLKLLTSQFPIRLKTTDGNSATELFWATDTIDRLKRAVFEKLSIPFGCQKIYFEDKFLTHGTLSWNGLKSDSVVIVMQSPRVESEYMICLKVLTGKEVEIHCDPNDTVERFKERVEEIEGIPPAQQRLLFRGILLLDDKLLNEYNIPSGSTVHLVLALRGC